MKEERRFGEVHGKHNISITILIFLIYIIAILVFFFYVTNFYSRNSFMYIQVAQNGECQIMLM